MSYEVCEVNLTAHILLVPQPWGNEQSKGYTWV